MRARLPQRRTDQRRDDQRNAGDLDRRQRLAEQGYAEARSGHRFGIGQ